MSNGGEARTQMSEHAAALKATLDDVALEWLEESDTPSVAVAFIENGRMQWSAVYGEQAPGVPADDRTLYNIASMTKPVTAEVVLRLASRGELSLDEPMSAYWIDPDISDNPWHELLTPEIALRHRTGFPNWRYQTNNILTFKFEPGTRTSYSGESYDYVARFAEKKTGTAFETLAGELVFSPAGMAETTFTKKGWTAGRLALPKKQDGTIGEAHLVEAWSAADNVHTTPAQYARFIIEVMNNKGVTAEIASERFEIVDDLMSEGCPVSPENCPVSVGMGLGWQIFQYQHDTVIMHGGSDQGERTIGYFVPERGAGVVIFTNGANGAKVISKVSALLFEHPQFNAFLEFQAQH
jgi:CubicO group peptidase (beta-lactamase class C family)